MQTEKIYMISDAAKNVKVEAHVLRYWEEELKLPVRRNEMGHRFYTEEDIKLFQRIKDLKDQGLQLKAIRNLLAREREQEGQESLCDPTQEKMNRKEAEDMGTRHVLMVHNGEVDRDARNEEHYKKLDNMLRNYSIKQKSSVFARIKNFSKPKAEKQQEI